MQKAYTWFYKRIHGSHLCLMKVGVGRRGLSWAIKQNQDVGCPLKRLWQSFARKSLLIAISSVKSLRGVPLVARPICRSLNQWAPLWSFLRRATLCCCLAPARLRGNCTQLLSRSFGHLERKEKNVLKRFWCDWKAPSITPLTVTCRCSDHWGFQDHLFWLSLLL